MKFLPAIALVAAGAAPAPVEQWYIVGSGGTAPTRQVQFVDRASLSTTADGKRSIREARYLETSPIPGVVALRVTARVDCNARTMTVTRGERIWEDGNAVADTIVTGRKFPLSESVRLVACADDWSRTTPAIGPLHDIARRVFAR